MAKVKVLMVEAPPQMILEWWREVFNHKPASVEDEKAQHTILARIERQRYFLFDEKTERISIEVGYCPECEEHIFFADHKGEAAEAAREKSACPVCYEKALEDGVEPEDAAEQATKLRPCQPDFLLLLPLERHLRTWLWDIRKKPLKSPCAPITRRNLRKEAVALRRLKDWEDLGSKTSPDPFPEDEEIEWVKEEDDEEEDDEDETKELPEGDEQKALPAPDEKEEEGDAGTDTGKKADDDADGGAEAEKEKRSEA